MGAPGGKRGQAVGDSKVTRPSKLEGHVTKFTPHFALKSIV